MKDNSFHIWFEQSGGFAGLTTSVEIRSDALPENERVEIARLIEQSKFFAYQENTEMIGMPDRFQYKITIEQFGNKKTLEFAESTMPEEFRLLVELLRKKARERK